MKVFISWSGDKSKRVAELLKSWLKLVVQGLSPWISTQNIADGELWYQAIAEQLNQSAVGVLCLTNDNKERPWIMFEAGALAKGLTQSRVCTILIDLPHSDVGQPLAQFNHTTPDRAGMLKFVKGLNSRLAEPLDDPTLAASFDAHWPRFERELDAIKQSVASQPIPKKREVEDLLVELLELSRSNASKLQRMEMSYIVEYKRNRKPADDIPTEVMFRRIFEDKDAQLTGNKSRAASSWFRRWALEADQATKDKLKEQLSDEGKKDPTS